MRKRAKERAKGRAKGRAKMYYQLSKLTDGLLILNSYTKARLNGGYYMEGF